MSKYQLLRLECFAAHTDEAHTDEGVSLLAQKIVQNKDIMLLKLFVV